MENEPTRNPVPAAAAAHVPATIDQPQPPMLDAHGRNPDDYDWIPVARKKRADGWSEEKQRLFIATLADTGNVTKAAREVGMTAKTAYELRRAADADGFAKAWAAAIRQGMNRLLDVCMERALEGTEEAVYDREGRVIGLLTRHHDRMAMFLLRAHMPELFGAAGERGRREPPAPVAEAMLRLDPAPPPEPAKLMHPDDLVIALDTADALDGTLPRWRRDPDLVARESEPPMPVMDEQFERDLAAAKAGTWRPPSRRGRRRV